MPIIRILTPDDAPAVIAHLRADNPAGLWSERHIAAVFSEPHEYVRMDDVAGGHVCRVSVNHRMPEVAVVWLLPETAQAALLPVFKAAMIAAADAEPAALAYPVRADFYLPQRIAAQTKAGAYKQLFPAATVVVIQQPDGRWCGRISMTTFGGAVTKVRAWL